ncbi:MAG: hypothetical protein HY919_01885 [Elusimicrobia bacterium]|nr:hypothetical protein [Elusimicrobiota bacterium]
MVIDTVNCSGKKWKDSERKWTFVCFCSLLFTFVHFCSLALYGYTVLGLYNFGDVVSGFSARSVGMGSTGITTLNDASALAINPATIINITANRAIVSVTPSYILFREEKRLIDPQNMYNANQELNLQNIKNEPVFFQLCSAGVALPVLRDRFIIGFNYSPVFSKSYKHSEEVTDGLMNVNENNYSSSGGLKKTDIGFGLKLAEGVSVGFSYGITGGKSEKNYEEIHYENDLLTGIDKEEASDKYDGGFLRYGLLLEKRSYVLGFFYQPSSIIEQKSTLVSKNYNGTIWDENTTLYNEEFKYPEKFGLGFSYRFKDKFRTLFVCDWERQNWNVLTYGTKTIDGVATGDKREHIEGYEKTDELKLGLEMWLNDSLPVRGGFRYQEFYYTWDKSIYNWYHASSITQKEVPIFYCFSVGGGYIFEHFDIDFGYEFGKRNCDLSSLERYDEFLQRFVLTARARW